MLEEGIVKLVQGDPAVAAIAETGGFLAELPKDSPKVPSWTHLSAGQTSNTTLTTARGLNTRRLQIDCYGRTPAEVIKLAEAIDQVLNGFQGTLADPDSTFVSSCFSTDVLDFFDDAPRSYRRMLEYEVLYAQN